MASLLHSPSRFYFTKNGKKLKSSSFKIFARFSSGDDDAILKAAISAASIRFQESLRSDPLFIDPYAGCFLSSISNQKDMTEQGPTTTAASPPCYYSLGTKFIDDKLLSLVSSLDELRQIVLLTDGMDTRPYRLSWPRSSVIYDISPGRVFKEASQRLLGVGAKVSKGIVLLHVPQESSNVQATLCKKGFSGNKPSVWVLQCAKCDFLQKLFMSHGFQVDVIEYVEIARKLHLDPPPGDHKGVLFIARQLRLSDAQMEIWREHFGRLEEEGDEDGFEEL